MTPRAPDTPAARRAAALLAIEDEVVRCRACPRLVAWREQVATEKRAAYRDETYWGRPVPGFGDPDAHLVVVGLAPRRTVPTAPGGCSRATARATSCTPRSTARATPTSPTAGRAVMGWPCAGPGSPLRSVARRRPTSPRQQERDRCQGYLERELEVLPWRVALVLGQFGLHALAAVLGVTPRPRFGHGVEVALPDGRVLLCSYHVSQQNTFTGRLTPAMFDEVLVRARELGEGRAAPGIAGS